MYLWCVCVKNLVGCFVGDVVLDDFGVCVLHVDFDCSVRDWLLSGGNV